MAVRLSTRLAQIASYVRRGESVCDIGTDHGFIPIWLVQNGVTDRVIMSDVSRGSLDKAIKDAEDELGKDNIPDARLGDGLDVLTPGEADCVIIAGMGGIQILDILTWDISKTLTYSKYIFQPRRDAALLRKWLIINGFSISDQTVVPENGRYSEILCVDSENAHAGYISFYEHRSVLDMFNEDPEGWVSLEYPDDLRDPSGRGVVRDYFESEIVKAETIAKNIRENASGEEDMLTLLMRRIERLEKLCEEMN